MEITSEDMILCIIPHFLNLVPTFPTMQLDHWQSVIGSGVMLVAAAVSSRHEEQVTDVFTSSFYQFLKMSCSASPDVTSPDLTSPDLTSPHLTSPEAADQTSHLCSHTRLHTVCPVSCTQISVDKLQSDSSGLCRCGLNRFDWQVSNKTVFVFRFTYFRTLIGAWRYAPIRFFQLSSANFTLERKTRTKEEICDFTAGGWLRK